MDLQQFMFAFIPMFVAFDALGIVPMYLGLTQGIDDNEKKSPVFRIGTP